MRENISREKVLNSIKRYLSQFSDESLSKKLEHRKQLIAMRKWFDSSVSTYKNLPNVEARLGAQKDSRPLQWSFAVSTPSYLKEVNETSSTEQSALAEAA